MRRVHGKASDMSADRSNQLSSKHAGDATTNLDDPEIVRLGPITRLVAGGAGKLSEGPQWNQKDKSEDDHR
jgi:hypothetical protein